MPRKRREVEPSLVVNQEWKRIYRKTFTQSLLKEPLWAKGLWSVMITLADENGEGNVELVRTIGKPAASRQPSRSDLAATLQRWCSELRISLFQKDDVTFYRFKNWDKYQGISFPTVEERRGDEIREENTDSPKRSADGVVSGPAASLSPEIIPPPIPRKPEPLLEFDIPADLFGLQLYQADQKLCKLWPDFLVAAKAAYPGVDILAEVKKAHAWEVANPANQKKLRTRFLGNWLARAQDKARTGSNGSGSTSGPGNGSGGPAGPASGLPERKCFSQLEDEYRERKIKDLFKERKL